MAHITYWWEELYEYYLGKRLWEKKTKYIFLPNLKVSLYISRVLSLIRRSLMGTCSSIIGSSGLRRSHQPNHVYLFSQVKAFRSKKISVLPWKQRDLLPCTRVTEWGATMPWKQELIVIGKKISSNRSGFKGGHSWTNPREDPWDIKGQERGLT